LGNRWERTARLNFSVFNVANPEAALRYLAKQTAKYISDPQVILRARAIVQRCPNRDDMCELRALYNTVKSELRYVADPVYTDVYASPGRLLKNCAEGACSGDCDEAASLIAALAGAIGFRVGLRAYGPPASESYSHVYAVAGYPKKNPTKWLGLDTTVKQAFPGWEPPMRGAKVKTAEIIP